MFPYVGKATGVARLREKPALSAAEGPHAGKYGELTPLRQRGGRGSASPLPSGAQFRGGRVIALEGKGVYRAKSEEQHLRHRSESSVGLSFIIGVFQEPCAVQQLHVADRAVRGVNVAA